MISSFGMGTSYASLKFNDRESALRVVKELMKQPNYTLYDMW